MLFLHSDMKASASAPDAASPVHSNSFNSISSCFFCSCCWSCSCRSQITFLWLPLTAHCSLSRAHLGLSLHHRDHSPSCLPNQLVPLVLDLLRSSRQYCSCCPGSWLNREGSRQKLVLQSVFLLRSLLGMISSLGCCSRNSPLTWLKLRLTEEQRRPGKKGDGAGREQF